jgi:serine/threonine protein kinase
VKVPDGYLVETVLSPGPAAFVALARGPAGGACVLKSAAVERTIPMLRSEAAVLRALGKAGVTAVPRVLDVWEAGFAMERIGIPTLRQGADRFGSGEHLDAVVRRALEGLAAVHSAVDPGGVPLEVVHGDLSPDNLYVALDGSRAVIADFGLARWRGGEPVEEGAFRGTLLYAAPEVARGEPFDGRADDFSLAASILHVATGVPLREETRAPAVTLVDAGTRPLDAAHPWRALAPKLFDRAVADALLACLAFDPRDRPRETPRPC